MSPTAVRMLKYAFNLADDGLVGQQLFAGETTRLAYMNEEAVEGRDAFLQKREPDWSGHLRRSQADPKTWVPGQANQRLGPATGVLDRRLD